MTSEESKRNTTLRMYQRSLRQGGVYKMKRLLSAIGIIALVLVLNGIATAIDNPEACKPKPEYKEVSFAAEKDLPKQIAEQYGLDPDIVKAIIKIESNGNPQAVGDNGQSIGLMQIQPKWHKARIDRLGITDLKDPKQNLTVGCDILAELLDTYGNYHMALAAYNTGSPYRGQEYADKVMAEANK